MLHPEMPKTNDYRCIAPRGEEGGGGRRREEEGGGGRRREEEGGGGEEEVERRVNALRWRGGGGDLRTLHIHKALPWTPPPQIPIWGRNGEMPGRMLTKEPTICL